MEFIDKNNENEEIVTVKPGEETLSVEEEIKAETPEEEKTVDDVKEETETPSVEETKDESSEVSDSVDEDTQESSEVSDVESKEDDKEDTKEEKKEEEEESEEKSEEEKTEEEKEETEVTEEETETEDSEELEKVKAELASMKEAEEVRKMEEARTNAINQAVKTYDEFNEKLADAVEATFKQYGIDPTISVEELQKDPAKMQIVQDIISNAQRIQAEKQAELMKPINDASTAIVFREASKVMAQFDLTDEQTGIAAETLINIFDATGLSNLTDDLRAKVELAVARAKMIAPKVEKVVEEVKEIVEDTKEAVKDVIEETSSEKEVEEKEDKVEAEDVQKEAEEKETTPEVVEEKPSLDAFKENAAIGNTASVDNSVDEDNVLQVLASLPFKERTSFLIKHADLINRAGAKRRAEGK